MWDSPSLPRCVPGMDPGGIFPPFPAMIPHFPLQNHSNSDVVSIDCDVELAPNEELNLHLHGNLWMKSLKAVSAPTKNMDLGEKSPSHPKNVGIFPPPGSPGVCGVIFVPIGLCVQHPTRHLVVDYRIP